MHLLALWKVPDCLRSISILHRLLFVYVNPRRTMKINAHTTNRRQFIHRLTTGLGAATLVPGLALKAHSVYPTRPDDEKLGVALVGLGSYATHQLAPALQQTKLCKLAGIVTGTPEKAERWKDQYGLSTKNIYSYETFDQIADNDDIDMVYVVLPNSMHAEFTIRAAEAGKHVLCEKPMAISVAEGQQMIDACKTARRKLGIGYRLQFEPHNLEVMRLGQEKVFGAIKVIEAGFGFRLRDPNQWRLKKALAGGGALMDVGIYAIQAARYASGEEPISVTAQEFKTDPEIYGEVDETIFWQMAFPSGAVSNSTTSYASYVERFYATAETGWFELGPAYSYSGIQGQTSQGAMDFPQVNQQALHMDDFADCIMQDRTTRVSGEEGLRDMKVIEAIYKAIQTGERVQIR